MCFNLVLWAGAIRIIIKLEWGRSVAILAQAILGEALCASSYAPKHMPKIATEEKGTEKSLEAAAEDGGSSPFSSSSLSLGVMYPKDLVVAVGVARCNLESAVKVFPDKVGRKLLIADPYLSAIEQDPMGLPNSVAATALDAILFVEQAFVHWRIKSLRNNVQDVVVLACSRGVRNVHDNRVMHKIFVEAFGRDVELDVEMLSRLFQAMRKKFGEDPAAPARRRRPPRYGLRGVSLFEPAYVVPGMAGPPTDADTDRDEALYLSVPAIEAMACSVCGAQIVGIWLCANCWKEHFDRV